MEELDLLHLTLPGSILNITWRNRTCCVSHYHVIYLASHVGTELVASQITTLYVEHHMEEQELLHLTYKSIY